jgi:DNA-binding CsgD family transcriptional regulator
MIDKNNIEDQLVATLLQQEFPYQKCDQEVLESCKAQAKAYVDIEGNIAVLSDFQANFSYIYIGSFGKRFQLPVGYNTINSAFEEGVFEKIHPDDLLERHVLELSYFRMQKMIDPEARRAYSTYCTLRIQDSQGVYVHVTHRTIYLRSFQDGSVWLALCLYSPATFSNPAPGIDGRVVNSETGEIIRFERYKHYGKSILTRREVEIINLIAKGLDSGKIAKHLNLSVYTIRRHRQNILGKLAAANTSEAIKTCSFMGLLNN